jgi:aldehyde dehydrogenase (NAD+)
MTQGNYIAGSWCQGSDRIVDVNPSDLDDTVGQFAQADEEDLERAVDAAREAHAAWSETGLEQRHALLMDIGRELMDRADELGELLSREEGKTLAEGRGEVYRSGQFFTYYAAEVLRQMGEWTDSVRPGVEVEARREPMGVVAVITPWNFPIATAAWKIAPALAFGNAVIWKPSNLTPATAVGLAEIVSRQQLPAGAFNLVMGGGSTIGNALVGSSGIDAVTFTGSLDSGRRIAARAMSNLTKIQLEMGSKNALYIDDEADLNTAVDCAVNGAFFGTGQKCTASSRLIVHQAVHDEFVDKLFHATVSLRVGHALESGTQIGPVVDENQLAQNEFYLELGKSEGARLMCGGERVRRVTEGYFMSPALFVGGDNDMRINREEIFGPIACVIEAEDYDHAVRLVNDTEYGLTSGIVTRSLAKATHFKRSARTGCVMVNLPTAGTDYHVPFGGRKNSSFGSREQGTYAREFYTQVKTCYTRADP